MSLEFAVAVFSPSHVAAHSKGKTCPEHWRQRHHLLPSTKHYKQFLLTYASPCVSQRVLCLGQYFWVLECTKCQNQKKPAVFTWMQFWFSQYVFEWIIICPHQISVFLQPVTKLILDGPLQVKKLKSVCWVLDWAWFSDECNRPIFVIAIRNQWRDNSWSASRCINREKNLLRKVRVC